jgi:hypothetical protein
VWINGLEEGISLYMFFKDDTKIISSLSNKIQNKCLVNKKEMQKYNKNQ